MLILIETDKQFTNFGHECGVGGRVDYKCHSCSTVHMYSWYRPCTVHVYAI